jgi:aromatic ring hydroxylase
MEQERRQAQVGEKTSSTTEQLFPMFLAKEAFANMAAAAIVNPKALEVMRRYLPNSYKKFVDIIREIVREGMGYRIINLY